MSDISDLESLLTDYQAKDESLWLEADICLDKSLVAEAERLDDEIEEARRDPADKRLSDSPADTAALEAELAEVEQRIAAKSITLRFKALTNPEYRKLAAQHPNAGRNDNEAQDEWLDALMAACLQEVILHGKVVQGATFESIADSLTYGELDPLRVQVFSLNRSQVSRPFSRKRSGATRTG